MLGYARKAPKVSDLRGGLTELAYSSCTHVSNLLQHKDTKSARRNGA